KSHRAAEQGDEADEAFGGMVARMDMPLHARAGQIERGHRFAAYPSVGQTTMDLGTNELVERRFREVEATLDRLFRPVREAAETGQYRLIDRSYRSGFDHSGFSLSCLGGC